MRIIINKDYYLSFVLLFQMLVVIIQQLLPLLGLSTIEQAATFRVYSTIATYLPAAVIIMRRNFSLLIFPFVVYGVVALFNYAFFPDSHAFLESRQAVTLTPIAIMTAIIVITIRCFDYFFKVLLWASRVSILLAIVYIWATKLLPVSVESYKYSMSFGYSLLLPALFLFRQTDITDKILGFVLFLLIILDGSRGPVVVIASYYVIHLIWFTKSSVLWKQIVATVLVGLLAYGGLGDVLSIQSSRTVWLYQRGEFLSHNSGRDIITTKAIAKIREHPVTGWGIGADRKFIKGYAHNLFLELAIHYGIVVTAFLIIGFIILVVSCFMNQIFIVHQGGRAMLTIMLLYGVVPLMVSNSYLISYSFALLMGYLLRIRYSPNMRFLSKVQLLKKK